MFKTILFRLIVILLYIPIVVYLYKEQPAVYSFTSVLASIYLVCSNAYKDKRLTDFSNWIEDTLSDNKQRSYTLKKTLTGDYYIVPDCNK